jgi:hypothetical protein
VTLGQRRFNAGIRNRDPDARTFYLRMMVIRITILIHVNISRTSFFRSPHLGYPQENFHKPRGFGQ